MFLPIAISAVIAFLVAAVLYLLEARRRCETEIHKLRASQADLSLKLTNHEIAFQDRRVQDAYQQGLYDGRETDAIYRGILSKHKAGEQFAVMMSGEQGETL